MRSESFRGGSRVGGALKPDPFACKLFRPEQIHGVTYFAAGQNRVESRDENGARHG
jgi:hypothetical protein